MQRLLSVGKGDMIVLEKVVAIISSNSAPAKRLKDEAREGGRLVDVSHGQKTRSFIITTANQVFLSAVTVNTLVERFQAESGRSPAFQDNS